jgi:hypothetical protein
MLGRRLKYLNPAAGEGWNGYLHGSVLESRHGDWNPQGLGIIEDRRRNGRL